MTDRIRSGTATVISLTSPSKVSRQGGSGALSNYRIKTTSSKLPPVDSALTTSLQSMKIKPYMRYSGPEGAAAAPLDSKKLLLNTVIEEHLLKFGFVQSFDVFIKEAAIIAAQKHSVLQDAKTVVDSIEDLIKAINAVCLVHHLGFQEWQREDVPYELEQVGHKEATYVSRLQTSTVSRVEVPGIPGTVPSEPALREHAHRR